MNHRGDDPVSDHLRCLGGAHQGGDAGAVDVGIHQSHPGPAFHQCGGQVGGHGGFPHAAFSAGHRDGVAYPGYQGLALGTLPASYLEAHFHGDRADSLERSDQAFSFRLDPVLDRAGRIGQLDGEGDPGALDGEILHEIQSDDVFLQVGVPDALEGLKHLLRTDAAVFLE